MIPRLEQLRKEVAEIDRDLAELGGRQTSLEEALRKVETARDESIIARYRAGEPVRVTDIDTKTKKLEDELRVCEATLSAMIGHRAVLEPELAELEAQQRLAEGWHLVAIPFIASKVLRGEQRGRINQAVAAARPEVSQNILGQDVVRKSIARNVDGSLPFFIQQLEFQAIEAARRVDPQFPRAETVDLEITGQSLGWDTRSSRRQDRRILTEIWEEFLRMESYFLEEHNFDIAPTAEEVSKAIETVMR